MAVLYSFKREDNGEKVEMFFPIGECPNEIVCEDGVKAIRLFCCNFSWKGSSAPTSVKDKQGRELTKKNIKAGERGRDYWKSKTPKLVQQ